MSVMQFSRKIAADTHTAWSVITDLDGAEARITAIKKMEILTAGEFGVGTRFRETRVMMGREAIEEMEVVEFDPPRSYVVAAHSCGSEYRTTMYVKPDGDGAVVGMDFQSTPVTLLAKCMGFMIFLMAGPMKKMIESDFDDIQKACESRAMESA